MMTFFFVLVIVLLIGVGLLFLVAKLRTNTGIIEGDVMYADSEAGSGELLQSTTVPLVGKPDYIIKKNGDFIPVEVKRGKTPTSPYQNHVAQLYAYCLLVEEHFGKRPPYGIVRYPDKEFTLEFPPGTEDHLKKTIAEMIAKKQSSTYRDEMQKVCRNCRMEHKNLRAKA